MIVKYQLQNYHFLYPELSYDLLDIEKKNDYLKNDTITDVFTNIHNINQHKIKDSFYKIHITLDKLFEKITSEILQNGKMLDMNIIII